MRILVRVKRPIGEIAKLKKVLIDGKTILYHKKKGLRPEWKIKFTNQSLYYTRILGFFKVLTIDVFPEAPEAIKYDYEVAKADTPKYDKTTSHFFVHKGVREALSSEMDKKPSFIQYLPIILMIIALGLLYLISRRLGVF